MVNDLTPILVTGIVMLAIYRILELFVRRNERMGIIERMKQNPDLKVSPPEWNLSFFNIPPQYSFASLRTSLFLIGMGIGLFCGYLLDATTFAGNSNNFSYTMEIVYLACIAVFGGVGLLIAYFMEIKYSATPKE
ncbi:MAG: DUF6249 domain-containing protein [Dysgonomonas sp.]|nr:DUF6249 domain-containing protein [Dysgonomonas sp.]